MAENAIFSQLKKAQGETNERLDALIAQQQRTNQLLDALLRALPSAQQQAVGNPPGYAR